MTIPVADIEPAPTQGPDAGRAVPADDGGAGATGELPIFGSEPAPARRGATPSQAQVRLWDNANIVESFPELTLPLTFSVAAEAYAIVYRSACLALGVPRDTVARESASFEHMLGLLQGRVYYNLESWYRVLALLPGFRLTAGFLEAMMGTARPGAAGDEQVAPVVARSARWFEMAGMTARLANRFIHFESDAKRFRAAIAGLLATHRGTPPADMSPQELVVTFDRFRASALGDWRAPIMNDLFLMLSHGALRRVADRWLGDEARPIVNALLVQGSVASALPGLELRRLTAAIRERQDWSDAVVSTPPEALTARLRAQPELDGLASLIDDYLEVWGDRAPRELQLERPSYRDDPLPIFRVLQSLLAAPPTDQVNAFTRAARDARRRLRAHPAGRIRVALFSVLLRTTRRHIRSREEMRLARGQVFGVGRRIVRRLGEVLCEQGTLERPEDIHYLSLYEVRSVVQGAADLGDPHPLIRTRRRLYEDYETLSRLPSRFETRGPIVDPLTIYPPPGAAEPTLRNRTIRGIGAAHGRVSAPCLVVLDPGRVTPIPGRIVVARSTDPGWVPILIGAAGLLVEQGSLLSHSAIVARELGIPTVVGLTGILDLVSTGDVVGLDGSTGEVTLGGGPELAARAALDCGA